MLKACKNFNAQNCRQNFDESFKQLDKIREQQEIIFIQLWLENCNRGLQNLTQFIDLRNERTFSHCYDKLRWFTNIKVTNNGTCWKKNHQFNKASLIIVCFQVMRFQVNIDKIHKYKTGPKSQDTLLLRVIQA